MDVHGRRSPVAQWIVAAISENIGLKITSLLIAMALFGLVRGAGNVQRSIEVNLLARLPPPSSGRVLLTPLPNVVRVTVRGSPSLVNALRPDEIGPVQIDLTDYRRAIYTFDASHVTLPPGVQFVRIDPPALQLSWDALVERTIPVVPEITGTPGPGLRLAGPVEVSPPSVRVSGPALYVEPLRVIRTDPLDITGLPPGRYERRLALAPLRSSMQYAPGTPNAVRVSFTIEREIAERRFERVTVTPVGTGRVEIRPPFVTVTVRGAPATIEQMDPTSIVPTVEVGDAALLRGPTRMPVTLSHLPAGTSLVSIEPTEVIVLPVR